MSAAARVTIFHNPRCSKSRGALQRLYQLGIRPDWWKLEPQATATAWAKDDTSV